MNLETGVWERRREIQEGTPRPEEENLEKVKQDEWDCALDLDYKYYQSSSFVFRHLVVTTHTEYHSFNRNDYIRSATGTIPASTTGVSLYYHAAIFDNNPTML